jgi:hypothetical protein
VPERLIVQAEARLMREDPRHISMGGLLPPVA